MINFNGKPPCPEPEKSGINTPAPAVGMAARPKKMQKKASVKLAKVILEAM